MGRLRDSQLLADLSAATDYLCGQPIIDKNRIAVIGFCMGGRVAYLHACAGPKLNTAVVFYGGNIMKSWGNGPAPFERSEGINCPILGLFGDDDTNPSPDDVAKIDDVNLTIRKEYLSPAYAFELGTEKTLNASAHFSSDVDKLRTRIKGTGYIIHFYKDVTQARTGTRSREKTEDRIDKLFKQVFTARRMQRIPKIKILAILLRTYRNQPKMRGKCEIFDGEKWCKVNINSNTALRHMIRRQLA